MDFHCLDKPPCQLCLVIWDMFNQLPLNYSRGLQSSQTWMKGRFAGHPCFLVRRMVSLAIFPWITIHRKNHQPPRTWNWPVTSSSTGSAWQDYLAVATGGGLPARCGGNVFLTFRDRGAWGSWWLTWRQTFSDVPGAFLETHGSCC